MSNESDLISLPCEFRIYRDALRVAGYDLVRYSSTHARTQAARYKHPTENYEFGIHKIARIENDRQIFINPNARYVSVKFLPETARHYVESDKPQGISLVTNWFKNPATAFVTVTAVPYGLTLLGLAAIAERGVKKQWQHRQKIFGQLAELPRFDRTNKWNVK